MKQIIVLTILACVGWSCKPSKTKTEYQPLVANPLYLHNSLNKLTEVMIYDIFSPPVASRIYSYATLAAYEAYVPGSKGLKSYAGKAKGLKDLPQTESGKEYCYELAALKAFMSVSNTLTFSVDKYVDFEKDLYKKFEDAGVPSSVIKRSMAHGEAIATAIMAYAKTDNYPQTRGLRYSIKKEPGKWAPTPPAYADAVEPLWATIRPMLMDSAAQFKPAPAIPYSENTRSAFMKEVIEVMNIGNTLTEDQKTIAWFWDDNAFVMNVQGHVMFADKKMTPGGHWLAIAQTAAKQDKADFEKTLKAYTLTSFALRDAFISCWDEKYRSEKIRPETIINEKLNPKWQPFLQTPPFPEYTSGHSTISAASAVALTAIFGENFKFTDSTEHKYGHGVRSFASFMQAAEESSVSRVFGGIHFTSACSEGLKAGKRIGQNVVDKSR
jgi:hypothetical protein